MSSLGLRRRSRKRPDTLGVEKNGTMWAFVSGPLLPVLGESGPSFSFSSFLGHPKKTRKDKSCTPLNLSCRREPV